MKTESRLESIIRNTPAPHSRSSLAGDLRRLGVERGMTLIVHSSLSRIGYVIGGAASVVLALEDVLGPAGTLAMPTHTESLTDPAQWTDPKVPQDWCDTIRREMPPFDGSLTPADGMGAIVECFRGRVGTLRSHHPFTSWAARGKNAEFITSAHTLSMSQGEGSPLARMYDLGAHVLLLGVGHACNTSLHLAEYRCRFAAKKPCKRGAPWEVDGRRRWVAYDDIYWCADDFEDIGRAFEEIPSSTNHGLIGAAPGRLFEQRKIVDFGASWMNEHRSLP